MRNNQMRRVRIKICGITRPEDAICAAALGADAIGLVFYRGSPRCIDIAGANIIIAALPPLVSKVGLFVDQDEDEIRSVLETLPLDYLQFHGNESPAECSKYNKPYIKSVAMQAGVDVLSEVRKYQAAACLLLDTHVEGLIGGTGQQFDWRRIPASLEKPLILAGGLTPDNVVTAITTVRPYAVDVSSGVEKSKGVKDPEKLAAFMQAVAGL
jgi:phosphoribosylanthranilate isomerase